MSEVPAVPEKGVADILKEAYGLYRARTRTLLLTCALLLVPVSLVKSCAVSVVVAPALAAEAATVIQRQDLEASKRALDDAYRHNADAVTVANLQELVRHNMHAVASAMNEFTFFVLDLVSVLVTAFFLYGLVVPIASGALSAAAADHLLGGHADARALWALVFRRLRLMLTAVIPAAALVAVGFAFFRIPGAILAVLFAFVPPVVLFEGLGGRAALQRSTQLVVTDWLRVALMVAVFAVLRKVAVWVAELLVPTTAPFISSLLGDLLTLVLLPLPLVAMALLYFDIRRKREGFTHDQLRAQLDALGS